MDTIKVKPKDQVRKWFLIDASGKRMGRVAVQAATLLRGKHKPSFTPNQEMGDYVIIINAEKAELTGNKVLNKIYYHHSGYPGGMRAENYGTIIERKPTYPMEQAVKGMLPKGPLGRKLFRNVKIYAGPEHPHAAQKPETLA
jgi:large subunit ribosomal protein L13